MSGPRSCTVFIGNIPYDATEEDLREVFKKVGSIDSLRLVYDKDTKQPKGYAFCDYSDPDTALSAIRNLNEVECNGRRLRIDLADNALRLREAAGKGGAPLPLALPAPEMRGKGSMGPPSSLSSFPPPSTSSLGPVPVGPGSAGGPLRPPGPPGSAPTGPSPEAVIAGVAAHSDIAQTIAAMPQAQLQLCLGAMQRLAVEAPEGSRAFLQEHPQLCYALLHAQLLLGLELDPRLPPSEEESQELRVEAARRPSLMAGVPGIVVPPNQPGFLGGMPRPCMIGPPGMAAYGIRPGLATNFGAAVTGKGHGMGPYAPVVQPGLQQPMVVGPPMGRMPPHVA